MTDDQINRAIAETCGWTILRSPLGGCGFAAYAKDPKENPQPGIPDYCTDLNAMHEAEKVLEEKKFVKKYELTLGRNGGNRFEWSKIHATARQRAEAFLRTLGKWEEAK